LSTAAFFIDGTGTPYGKKIILRPKKVLLFADVHETQNLRFKARERIRIAREITRKKRILLLRTKEWL
jgi:hypothetical protein